MAVNAITIVTIGFLIMEATNMVMLYFFPDSKFANGVGVFKAWEKTKQDPDVHAFVKYLVNWVAGTKLIVILLLIVIILTTRGQTLVFTGVVMVISIASFFWRLFPLIQKMDRSGQIEPRNYSATLGWMVLVFIASFLAATVITFLSAR